MILWEDKSKAFLCPEIFFNESCDEIEGRWLEPVFKACKDLACGLNAGGRSSLEWSPGLEEWWVGREWMLNAEIIFEELFFNTHRAWENDEEMHYSGFLLRRSMIDFEVLSLKIMDVKLNLEFFRWVRMNSNVVWDDDMDGR